MPGRIRTTKKLAQRIDRGYFKRLFPLPLWRRLLSLAAVCAGLAWLGLHALAHDQSPYTSGPVTKPHATLAGNCAGCHRRNEAFGAKITDTACLACHYGPLHNAAQTFAPACVECHVEHRGAERLADASGQTCMGCHSNLQTKTGRPRVAANVGSFAREHPEFAALRDGAFDPSAIKFSHWKHVKIGPKLQCAECHRQTGVDRPWNFGHTPAVPPPPAAPRVRVSPRALMQPVNYYEQCSGCHQLTFDERLPDAAPHDTPAVVHAFVTQKLRQYIAGHPAELGKANAPRSAGEWIAWRANQDETELWTKTCERCHNMQQPAAGTALPSVPKTMINRRWFTNADFDHSAHREVQCISCHADAPFSTKASQVLVPGIALCRECHGAGVSGASADCSTCHLYHDWSKAPPPVDGKLGLRPR